MDFFKKIFEKVVGGAGAEGGTASQMEGGMDRTKDMSRSQGGEEAKKAHDGGHPNGDGGKNVCEFC